MSEPDDPRPQVRDPRFAAGERVYTAAVWVVLFAAVVLAAFGRPFSALGVVLLAVGMLGILGWAAWTLFLMRRLRRDMAALEAWYRRHPGPQ